MREKVLLNRAFWILAFLLTPTAGVLFCQSSGSPAATIGHPAQPLAGYDYGEGGNTFDHDTAITVTEYGPRLSGSLTPSTIEVSNDEKVIFHVTATDTDMWKATGSDDPWTEYAGTGPYQMQWTCSSDARFDSPGGMNTTKTTEGLHAVNVYVYTNAAWTGATAITVTCVIKDNAPPVTAPDEGSVNDVDKTITWTLNKRGTGPTTVATITGAINVWRADLSDWIYQVGADDPPSYLGQSVLESFGSCTAGFSMDDLTDDWKAEHYTILTADDAAAIIFNSGSNTTFVCDANDEFEDGAGGFGSTSPFLPASLDSGVTWMIRQHYSAGGTLLGSDTISRRYVDGIISVQKDGP